MDERKANIDLAFRNGLKDYEILPPPEVWNNIDNRLKKRNRPLYMVRAAAFLAIAMTMSVLAYRWIGQSSASLENNLATIDQESTAPVRTAQTTVTRNRSSSPVTEQRIADNSISGNIETNKEITPNSTTFTGAIKMPQTNLTLPVNSTFPGIIHASHDFGNVEADPIALENPSAVYQDYLSVTTADENQADKSGKWSIAALASPTYYGTINSGSSDLSKQIMASEQSVISYSGGFALAYKLNKRLSIQSGLFYSSVGQDLNGINSFAGFRQYDNNKGDHNFEVLTSNGNVATTNSDVFLFAEGSSERIVTNYTRDVFDPQKASLDYINNSMRQSLSFLELPVFLRYKLIDRTVDLNLIGGLSYNLLVNNSVYTVIDGNKYMIGTTEGLNMFSVSSSFGMGMEYKFSDKLSLNLEPTFRYYLNTFNSSGSAQFHPYSFGIFSGLSYKF